MPEKTSSIRHSTLSDRDLLLHILAHVEDLWETLDEFRPLLALMRKPGGKPDFVGIMHARRELRKAGNGT